jgi:phenylacetate 2-hydroxylase
VLNSFDDCRRMYTGYPSSIIDRPVPHTIKAIASTKGLTIGTSPWDDSTKRRRKVAVTALSRSGLGKYRNMLDQESYSALRELTNHTKLENEISIRHLIQRFALNSTLTLCYGVRFDSEYSDVASEILDVGHSISRLRGTSENLQDYIPIMRYLPSNEKAKLSKELCVRRDQYLSSLLKTAKERFQRDGNVDCIYSAVLTDKEVQLSKEEISTVCLSLVSGGFETIPGTIISCIGSLSTTEGQVFQAEAVRDIQKHYSTMQEAWDQCLVEEKVPYINAIVKEALRYYTVLPLGQPRKAVRDIEWNGSIIPQGTTILFNTQAANHGTYFILYRCT